METDETVATNISTSRLLAAVTTVIAIGTVGFNFIDGMIVEDAGGNHLIDAFYCSVITLTTWVIADLVLRSLHYYFSKHHILYFFHWAHSVGYGDICPSDDITHFVKPLFAILSFCGVGLFCGPIMDFAASWEDRIPGGVMTWMLCTCIWNIAIHADWGYVVVLRNLFFIHHCYYRRVWGFDPKNRSKKIGNCFIVSDFCSSWQFLGIGIVLCISLCIMNRLIVSDK